MTTLNYDNDPEGIREIARRQKIILFCILGYLIIYAVLVATQSSIPLIVQLILLGTLFAVSITATVFVFLLATKIYGTGVGVLLGVLTLIPCVGLIVLLVVNAKATALLRQNGFKVGLLGAKID